LSGRMAADPYRSYSAGYASVRRPDPRITARIRAALSDCSSVANVGAGAGSYEPSDLDVIAVEPSWSMLSQRARDSASVVQGRAESVPLRNWSVDAALAVLTIHHWENQAQGLRECIRVARRCVLLLTFDSAAGQAFWLTRDYFPEIHEWDNKQFPKLDQLRDWMGPICVEPVAIPADCIDGFLGAYWRRPHAYLDAHVRAGMSTFAKIRRLKEGLESLRSDLDSGVWEQRYGHLLSLDELDIGYRLVVRHCGAGELPDSGH
jgi:SAM-dependent methyltransferase